MAGCGDDLQTWCRGLLLLIDVFCIPYTCEIPGGGHRYVDEGISIKTIYNTYSIIMLLKCFRGYNEFMSQLLWELEYCYSPGV